MKYATGENNRSKWERIRLALIGSCSRPLGEETPKPRCRRNAGKFLFLLLVFCLTLGAILVPGFRGHLERIFPHSSSPILKSGVVVWTDKHAGSYYCAGSSLYGKGQGTYMEQGKALTLGYQPALGRYSPQGQVNDFSELKVPPGKDKQIAGSGIE
jgi:hypothetical protein